jgi:hypothetical protein
MRQHAVCEAASAVICTPACALAYGKPSRICVCMYSLTRAPFSIAPHVARSSQPDTERHAQHPPDIKVRYIAHPPPLPPSCSLQRVWPSVLWVFLHPPPIISRCCCPWLGIHVGCHSLACTCPWRWETRVPMLALFPPAFIVELSCLPSLFACPPPPPSIAASLMLSLPRRSVNAGLS